MQCRCSWAAAVSVSAASCPSDSVVCVCVDINDGCLALCDLFLPVSADFGSSTTVSLLNIIFLVVRRLFRRRKCWRLCFAEKL